MDLPSAQSAAAWFVQTARAALEAGERLDLDSIRTLLDVAPADPVVRTAIERLVPGPSGDRLRARARDTSWLLRMARASHDEAMAREAVTTLELQILAAYRPGHGCGRFEDDVAVAAAMLDAHEVGGDPAHQMMAEELMLVALRRYWPDRGGYAIDVNAEAAIVFSRLEKLEYRPYAVEALGAYAGTYQQHGLQAALYVLALHVIS